MYSTLGITTLVEKCNLLQEYNFQLESQVTVLQSQVVELQKELGGSFKSTVALQKNDDLNAALFAVHRKFKLEFSLHAS